MERSGVCYHLACNEESLHTATFVSFEDSSSMCHDKLFNIMYSMLSNL